MNYLQVIEVIKMMERNTNQIKLSTKIVQYKRHFERQKKYTEN